MSGDSLRTVTLSRLGRHHFQAENSRGGTLSFGNARWGEFTPVELLLVAIGGCTAMDVDAITVKRSEPARFQVTCSGHYSRSVHGNPYGRTGNPCRLPATWGVTAASGKLARVIADL